MNRRSFFSAIIGLPAVVTTFQGATLDRKPDIYVPPDGEIVLKKCTIQPGVFFRVDGKITMIGNDMTGGKAGAK